METAEILTTVRLLGMVNETQLGRILGLYHETCKRYRQLGKLIPTVRTSRRVLYDESAVGAFLNDHWPTLLDNRDRAGWNRTRETNHAKLRRTKKPCQLKNTKRLTISAPTK